MSLATRCPACGTVFRVVQDQLKVSEGWVRCGRCEDVFNALEGLFDLDREPPPPWTGSAAADTAPPSGFEADDRVPEPAVVTPKAQAEVPFSASTAGLDRHPLLDAHARIAEAALAVAASAAPAADSTWAGADSARAAAPTLVAPTFVQRAERLARWQQPRVRAGLALATVMLAALLLVQAAAAYRDSLASRWPAVAPWLTALCQPLECRVAAPRKIESLSVDSSSLVKLDGADLYRLAVVLRNHDSAPVMMPAFEISLSDLRGELIARKVLSAADFGTDRQAIAGAGELSLQTALNAGDLRVAGYTVELFYP